MAFPELRADRPYISMATTAALDPKLTPHGGQRKLGVLAAEGMETDKLSSSR